MLFISNKLKQIFILLILISLSACASSNIFSPSISGGPKRTVDVDKEVKLLSEAFSSNAILKYYSLPETSRETTRDSIVGSQMYAIDLLYSDFERKLSVEARSGNFLATTTSIALSGVGSVLRVAETQAILAAIDTGLKGTKESFDKEILLDRTLQILLTQMDAERAKVRVRVLNGLQNPVSRYSLQQGLTDLQDYERAGTINSALAAITGAATQTANISKASLNPIRFERTLAYEQIKACVFQDPNDANSINVSLRQQMNAWLITNRNLLPANRRQITITQLILSTSPDLADFQRRLISQFCSNNT